MKEKQTSLYYREGSSDKEYHAQLVSNNGGFVVNFQYGRRGAALQTGSKTISPVEYSKAEKIFDKLVSEKLAKGYSPGREGMPFQGTHNEEVKTGFVPQLCNPITESEAKRLLADDNWAVQEKMDGDRRAVRVDEGTITGINRKGLAVALPKAIAGEIKAVSVRHGNLLLDGELIGDVLHVFDLHILKIPVSNRGWLERFCMAQRILNGLVHIKIVPVAVTAKEKLSLWNRVLADNGEGLVFKLKDGAVKPGRPNSGGDWLKFKFVERCSCIVSRINLAKRSVALHLLHEGKKVPVGNVTIPPNADIPLGGQVVEVEYLYAYRGGSLYQPVYKGKRTDIDPDECGIGQLKFKPEA